MSKSKFNKLMAEAHKGDFVKVRQLVEARPSLGHATDPKSGQTALMLAAIYGNLGLLETMLPVSDCRAADEFGDTALMVAALFGRAECVKALLPVSNTRAVNEDGLSASLRARDYGHDAIANLIDAYELAKEERVTLCRATDGRAARRSSARSL